MKIPALILSLLFFYSISQKSFAQEYHPFPTSNAVWNTVGENLFSGEDWKFRYTLYGDTMINSIQYQKVYKMYDSTILHPNSSYFAAIRENENRQVYGIIPGFEESILYDFNMEVGDTIWYHIGGSLCENGVYFEEGWSHYRILMNIDSVALENNQYRKSFQLNGELLQDTWVEGIGSLSFYGLFYPLIADLTLCGDDYSFACFKHHDEILYLNNPNCNRCFCDLMTTTEEITNSETSGFKVFPNPANENIHTIFNESMNSFYEVQILNSEGKILRNYSISKPNSQLKIKDLEPGIYLLKATNLETHKITTEKLIIER